MRGRGVLLGFAFFHLRRLLWRGSRSALLGFALFHLGRRLLWRSGRLRRMLVLRRLLGLRSLAFTPQVAFLASLVQVGLIALELRVLRLRLFLLQVLMSRRLIDHAAIVRRRS